jgi:putative flippase GtrA
MQRVLKLFSSREFVLFLLTGGTAAAVNFCSRFFYNQWFSFSTSIVIAYITGMITAYLLAKAFVFKASKQTVSRSIFFFVLINIFAVLQTWAISMWLAYQALPALHIIEYSHEIAHAIGIVIPVFTSYIGHKRFSFK